MTGFGLTAGGGEAVDGAAAAVVGGSRPGGGQRRWTAAEKARIVAESHEPGATVVAVAARHGISTWSLSRWRRCARESSPPAVTAGDAAPPFVPVVVEDAAPDRLVTFEAGGVVVRLPGDSPVERIVGVAAGLCRAS